MSFPHNLTLEEVTQAIQNHNAVLGTDVFIRAVRGDFIIFNYSFQFDGMFPTLTGDPVRDREILIIRECRGLTFHSSGRLVARKLHKFKNVNESEETLSCNVDFTQDHIIMEKLDGSLLVPVPNGDEIEWHTKMGATDVAQPVEEFVKNNPHYRDFAKRIIESGQTAMFEWCSRQQKIVIDYPEDKLVLLHIRDNHTGNYHSREYVNGIANQYGIPSVAVFDGSARDIDAFIEYTRGLKDQEGFVIQFHDGKMLKIKADDYLTLHRMLDLTNQEKNVIDLIFSESADDVIAHLDSIQSDRVKAFQHDAMLGIGRFTERINNMAKNYRDQTTNRGEYAKLVNQHDGLDKQFLFRAYDNTDLVPDCIKMLRRYTASSSRVEIIRPMIGNIFWKDY